MLSRTLSVSVDCPVLPIENSRDWRSFWSDRGSSGISRALNQGRGGVRHSQPHRGTREVLGSLILYWDAESIGIHQRQIYQSASLKYLQMTVLVVSQQRCKECLEEMRSVKKPYEFWRCWRQARPFGTGVSMTLRRPWPVSTLSHIEGSVVGRPHWALARPVLKSA